jgi:LPXTG-motif cell wall-anchored protein
VTALLAASAQEAEHNAWGLIVGLLLIVAAGLAFGGKKK